jgi:hypothetical protein
MDWFQHGVAAEVCGGLLKERLSAYSHEVLVAGSAPATAHSVGFPQFA